MTWVVSSNGGDDVSHYTVVLSEDLNFTQTAYSKNLSVVDNSELTQKGGMVTVAGLSGGTTYYAKVVARNCVGASVPATQSCSIRCGQCICYQLLVFKCCLVSYNTLCCVVFVRSIIAAASSQRSIFG